MDLKIDEVTTTNLAKFGNREKAMAGILLIVMSEQGLPRDFYDDEVTVMMNTKSGNVFLTNSEFQCAMMKNGRLESWYNCPNCGAEGYWGDVSLREPHRQQLLQYDKTPAERAKSMRECAEWIKQTQEGR